MYSKFETILFAIVAVSAIIVMTMDLLVWRAY